MAEEGPPSEVSITVEKSTIEESVAISEVTVESNIHGVMDSSSNNSNENKNATETTAQTSDGSDEKSLEFAEELMEKGFKAMKDNDYSEAVDCFSRALEVRAAHYGELSPECVKSYYKYGCALLYKAQEEADPLGAVPKKDDESHKKSDKDGSVKTDVNGESSKASVSTNAGLVDGATDDNVSGRKDEDEDADDSDAEDLPDADADEDESDLDLAWKMLDVARAIVEKDSGDTIEKVDILSALAEVSLEREDIETSLTDYQKALTILERLVEPDNRQIAELNFRICLCLEFGSQPQEARTYCKKAISICKSRVLRLNNDVLGCLEPMTASSTSVLEEGVQPSSDGSQIDNALLEKQSEIETLSGLLVELEKKLEDLQQLASNPKSILSEILGIGSARAKVGENGTSSAVLNSTQMGTANSNGGFDSPTVSTAHTNGPAGVTHLGVVGRGVKRVSTNSESADSNPMKKLATDSAAQDKGDGSST